MPRERVFNLKNENVISHGFIDFYLKIFFIKPFSFEKKVFGSFQSYLKYRNNFFHEGKLRQSENL